MAQWSESCRNMVVLTVSTAVKAMNQMYMANRLFINFFQPSFKFLETQRVGGKTVRRHDAPKTPYNRLIMQHSLRFELRCDSESLTGEQWELKYSYKHLEIGSSVQRCGLPMKRFWIHHIKPEWLSD